MAMIRAKAIMVAQGSALPSAARSPSQMGLELKTQPANWLTGARVARKAASLLPAAGERVAISGCDTSYFVAQSAACLREQHGQGETDAFPASETPLNRRYDRYLIVTRSGVTSEVLDLLKALPAGAATVAITVREDLPVVQLARQRVLLPFADEASIVQTRFATTALALLRVHAGDSIEAAAADGERALADPLPVEPTVFNQFVFLGRGWSVGVANEAALKLREVCGAWAESYPAMEYRHGPISVAGPQTLVWLLGVSDPALAVEVRATGATVIEGRLDPMAELIRVQRLALARAESRGLDPDHPRHLQRAVVLP